MSLVWRPLRHVHICTLSQWFALVIHRCFYWQVLFSNQAATGVKVVVEEKAVTTNMAEERTWMVVNPWKTSKNLCREVKSISSPSIGGAISWWYCLLYLWPVCYRCVLVLTVEDGCVWPELGKWLELILRWETGHQVLHQRWMPPQFWKVCTQWLCYCWVGLVHYLVACCRGEVASCVSLCTTSWYVTSIGVYVGNHVWCSKINDYNWISVHVVQ